MRWPVAGQHTNRPGRRNRDNHESEFAWWALGSREQRGGGGVWHAQGGPLCTDDGWFALCWAVVGG